MAEFGENLRRIREEKGITQQTMADHLYVTRQAVSRWEGGSRYPDLMTAKKMSRYLGVSMDELVSDDDMQEAVEKTVILETPVAQKVQLVLMTLAFMGFTTMLVIEISYLLSNLINKMVYFDSYGIPLRNIMLLLVLGYGIFHAVGDKLNPRVASVLSVPYFGTGALANLATVLGDYNYSMLEIVWGIFLNVVPGILIPLFFEGRILHNPMLIYIMLALGSLSNIPYYISMFTEDYPVEMYVMLLIVNTLSLIAHTLIIGLLAYMVFALHRKRKQATL